MKSLEEVQKRLYFGLTVIDCRPVAIPTEILKLAKTDREAVRLSLQLSKVKMNYRAIAQILDCPYQHVGDWFNKDDKPTRRSMPMRYLNRYEKEVVGNTFLTQWFAMQSDLTVMEEVQANTRIERERMAA